MSAVTILEPSETSPFASVGRQLIAKGYSALPLMPGEKVPGKFTGDVWRFLTGWSRYCEELPKPFQANLWASWPNAGVGVAAGRGLLAFDIDRDEYVDAIKAVLPPALVAKRGRKGETLFYRGDTTRIRSRGFKIDGLGVMDLISDGKQTVLPPSIHPQTGLPYVWTTERTLADTPLSNLTEVTEAHVDAVIEVLKGFGYDPDGQSGAWNGGVVIENTSVAADFFRRLNEDALANLDAWVPRLGLARVIRQTGGGWRAVAQFRASNSGNPIHKRPYHLSFNPKGIVDYGDGDQTYTALNVVMKMLEADLNLAAKWLGECLGYDFTPQIVLTQRTREPSEQMQADVETAPAEPVEVVEAPALKAANDDMQASRGLLDLTRPAGLVGEIVDWIEASAEYPSRELALGAAIGWVATLAGRGFETPTRARTNFYFVALAPSGFGKDHAGSCMMSLAQRTGLERLIGPARFMSASALRESLMEQPSLFAVQDEFGGILRQIDGPKVGIHNEMIRVDLLTLFSRAKDLYAGAAYAAARGVKLFNPNLTILGLSTPDDFWSAISSARTADGFLARFVMFNVEGAKPKRTVPKQSSGLPPTHLIEASRALYQAACGGGNLASKLDGSFPQKAKCVNLSSDAQERLAELEVRIERLEGSIDTKQQPILNRTREHALKLALAVAVGEAPSSPLISADTMQWAADLAWLSMMTLIEQSERHVADNDRQRDFKKMVGIIRDAGEEGISKSVLLRRLGAMIDKRRREELLEEAQDSKLIEHRIIKPATGRPSARSVSL